MNADDIRMFAKATEIQDLWTPRLCDRVCLKKSAVPKVDYIVRETLEKFDSYYIRRWCTWLPYQHQILQELQGSGSSFLFGVLYMTFLCPERCGDSDHVEHALGEYRRKTFKSIDAATLGLVMSVQYNKYWWNGKWCKRVDER